MLRCRLLVVLLIVGLAGCTSDKPPVKAFGRVVAIGDSYVSGPGIPAQDPSSPACVRSDHNYPSLVAKRLRAPLTDVSCGGSTTETVQSGRPDGQGGSIPSQLDALGPATKLVMVGVGANDDGLYLGMFVSCLVKTSASDTKCRELAETRAPAIYAATRDRVAAILSEVKKRAPEARVLLVGYLRIVPDAADCSVLPMSEKNRGEAMKVEVAMTDAQRDAARTADVEFVDVRAMSEGHDACAGKSSWVNGTAGTVSDGAILHPNKAGMRAVARMVLETVDQP